MHKKENDKMKELEQRLIESETKAIADICKILSDYEINTFANVADIVSSMCDVDKKAMFSLDRRSCNIQARGLFFYACRYMTSYTYEKTGEIAEKLGGKKFPAQYVQANVVKMGFLIENTPIWGNRWGILKNIIKKAQQQNK